MTEYIQRDPKTSFWRTLARVVEVTDFGNVYLCFPAWCLRSVFKFPMDDFPLELYLKMKPDFRFYVDMNLGVDRFQDLQFKDWRD